MDCNPQQILKQLRSPAPSYRIAALQALRKCIKNDTANVFFSNPRTLLSLLAKCLNETDEMIVQPAMQSISEIAEVFLDFPTYLPLLLPCFVNQVGHAKGSIRRLAVETLTNIAQQFRNVNTIIEALMEHGFEKANSRVRQGSILVIMSLVEVDPNLDLEALVPKLVEKTNDANSLVAQNSKTVLNFIRKESTKFRKTLLSLHPKVLTRLQNILDADTESGSLFRDSEGNSGHIGFVDQPQSSRRSSRSDVLARRERRNRSSRNVKSARRNSKQEYSKEYNAAPDLSSVLKHTSYGRYENNSKPERSEPKLGGFPDSARESRRGSNKVSPILKPSLPNRKRTTSDLFEPNLESLSLTAKAIGPTKVIPHTKTSKINLEEELDDLINDPGTPYSPNSNLVPVGPILKVDSENFLSDWNMSSAKLPNSVPTYSQIHRNLNVPISERHMSHSNSSPLLHAMSSETHIHVDNLESSAFFNDEEMARYVPRIQSQPNDQKFHKRPSPVFTRPATETSHLRKQRKGNKAIANKLNLLKRNLKGRRAVSAQVYPQHPSRQTHSPIPPAPLDINHSHPSQCNYRTKKQRKRLPLRAQSEQRPRQKKKFEHTPITCPDYSTSQLPPCRDPENELKLCLVQINSKDWKDCFEALNSIRKLAQHHGHLLIPHLGSLCPFLASNVSSLRSQVSRTATMSCTALFENLGKKIEPHLEQKIPNQELIPNLLKRAADPSNEFLTKEADSAFKAMVANISPNKALDILLHHSKSKHPAVRSKIAVYIENVVIKVGKKVLMLKKYNDLLRKIGAWQSEAKASIRNTAKRIILHLMHVYKESLHDQNNELFLNDLRQNLKVSELKKVQQVMLKGKHQDLSMREASPSQKRARCTPNMKRNCSFARVDEQPSEQFQEELQNLLYKTESSDWRARLQSVGDLVLLCEKEQRQCEVQIFTILDHLTNCMSDRNSKVQIKAIQSITSLVTMTHLTNSITRNLQLLLQPVVSNFGSSNANVRRGNEILFERICEYCNHQELIPILAKSLQQINLKIKSTVFPKFNTLVKLRTVSNSILFRNVIPLAVASIDSKNTHIKHCAAELFQFTYDIFDQKLFTHHCMSKITKFQLNLMNDLCEIPCTSM